MNKSKVGLSLSFCVQDIILGKMDINNVQFISISTRIENNDHWQEVMDLYCKVYWTMNPTKGLEIATQLRDAGKLIQPRLEGLKPVGLRINRGYWIAPNTYNSWMKKVNNIKEEQLG